MLPKQDGCPLHMKRCILGWNEMQPLACGKNEWSREKSSGSYLVVLLQNKVNIYMFVVFVIEENTSFCDGKDYSVGYDELVCLMSTYDDR